jgi:protein-tyrosine phosphatase
MEAAYHKIYQAEAGFLAIMARPQLSRGQPDSIATLADNGIECIVSLLEAAESSMLGLDTEAEVVTDNGMSFISFPITDYGVPSSQGDFSILIADLFQQLKEGSNVLLHCRGGVGRSGLVAAGVLLQTGLDPIPAFNCVSDKRGIRVPETTQQRDWLIDNYESIVKQNPGLD